MTANPLWDVIQAYMDSPLHEYAPRPADLARKTGVSEQVLSKWKSRPTLPTPEQMVKIADGTGLPYAYLLEAALQGKRFLPLDTTISARPAKPLELLKRRVEALQFAINRAQMSMNSDEREQFTRRMEDRIYDFILGQAKAITPDQHTNSREWFETLQAAERQHQAALQERALRAVASDGGTPAEAAEADRQAAIARAEQEHAMREMDEKAERNREAVDSHLGEKSVRKADKTS